MNLNFNKIKMFFSKKILLQLYFLIFILLNIFDFLNLLSSDIDFFKKLLSWTIIGYIFYKASPTKIFIGKRVKFYDIIFILGFSLMSIIKSLVLYTREGIYVSSNFYIFNYILTPISKISGIILINNLFLLGLIIIILTSILLLYNYNFFKKSFLGSFNFSKYFLFMKFQYLTLILFAIFFGLIIFNFFMEWFALAVDSVILVIGLIFYIFKYFHNHSTNNFSNYLRSITNTGNNFYNNLILAFSDKKTVLIGISFLLTIHLIVDVGVYMVPYSIGTQNSLYFNSLDTFDRAHISLINIFDFENSQIYVDLNNTKNSYILSSIVILIYLISIFSITSLLIFPFYIFYKNILKEKIKINNIFAILFLISIFFLLMISLLPNIKTPISISSPNVDNINGVDIYTNQITKNISNENFFQISNELLVSIILLLTITIFLIFRYQKYNFFFNKIIFIIVLLFFLYYISIFFYSTVEKEYKSIFPKFNSAQDYNNKYTIYSNPKLFKNKNSINFNYENIKFKINTFSNESVNNILNNFSHKDYMLIQISNYNKKFNINFKDISNVYLFKKNDYKNSKFNSKNIKFIYFLGENYITIKKNKRIISLNQNLEKKDFEYLIKLSEKQTFKELIIKFLEYLRLIFISIFYIFGSFTFFWHYSKTNIF